MFTYGFLSTFDMFTDVPRTIVAQVLSECFPLHSIMLSTTLIFILVVSCFVEAQHTDVLAGALAGATLLFLGAIPIRGAIGLLLTLS